MDCFERILLVKDIILSGSALVGAIVAIKGLNTWQRQLKGQAEYDLARRLLVSLFKFRDAIDGVRHPILEYETSSSSLGIKEGKSYDQIQFEGVSKAYQIRWDKVQNERASLSTDILEAEALWGSDLKELFKDVFRLEKKLYIAIVQYLELINPNKKMNKEEIIPSEIISTKIFLIRGQKVMLDKILILKTGEK